MLYKLCNGDDADGESLTALAHRQMLMQTL